MKKKFVVANWKMNGDSRANAELLAALTPEICGLEEVNIVICPPAPYIPQVLDILAGTGIKVGAQNLSHETKGAFTGEISANMLKDLGCRYVLVGHSERRSLYGENDELVAEKFEAALSAGLVPILCVGESLEERKSLITHQVIARQLQAVIEKVGIQRIAEGVIAYEPVWAIGTGETATPAQAQAVHFEIRKLLGKQATSVARNMSLLYGGSVRAENAAELFAQADIDGGLIGGASLDADAFRTICRSA